MGEPIEETRETYDEIAPEFARRTAVLSVRRNHAHRDWLRLQATRVTSGRTGS